MGQGSGSAETRQCQQGRKRVVSGDFDQDDLRETVSRRLDDADADHGTKRSADEEGGEPAADAFCYAEGPAALLVGPEGGFDDAERAAIRAHPASVAISLGPRILRGETAAIAGMAVWMAEAGDWLDAD